VLRLGLFIGSIALVGVLLSSTIAYRTYYQNLSLDEAALNRAVDIHARLVQERLNERELMARIVVGLLNKSSLQRGNVLEPLRSSIDAFNTDFVVAGWIARIAPSGLANAEKQLAAFGFSSPNIRDAADQALSISSITQPADVLMDVEPRNAETLAFPGRSLDRHPVLGRYLLRAAQDGKFISSDPLALLRPNGPIGIVLIAPVMQNDSANVAGFITFSYRIAPLMLANDDSGLFDVVLADPRHDATNLMVDQQGTVQETPARADVSDVQTRKVVFGGRDWALHYFAKTDSTERAKWQAMMVAALGALLTFVTTSLFGYVVYNNMRLSREIQVRIDFEDRLTAVIGELNHRVKNILAVIQSIVTRTLRHGTDIDSARELLIGRMHAMSHVVTLLSDSQWQGVKLRGLLESRAIPHAERIEVSGPDIAVGPRAAQSLSLLFFELASHADEGLSLVGKHPNISARWQITGEGKDAVFDFRWEELNTSEATRRPESEFGATLLDRVAPEALGGTSKRYFTDVSYVYELTAPMDAVIDQAELDRTDRLASPLKSAKLP
jgi:two-component sensor histidine kinase